MKTIRSKLTMTSLFFFLAMGFFSPRGLASQTNCSALWERGFPDPRIVHTPYPCHYHTPSSGPEPRIELYYSEDLIEHSALPAMLELVQKSLEHSVSSFKALGAVPPIKAIIHNRAFFQDEAENFVTYAVAILAHPRPVESCPILIFPSAFSFSPDYLKQLVAHEVFHCFQLANFKAQTMMAITEGPGVWWLEGTAEFFGNYAYPFSDMEYTDLTENYSPTQSLHLHAGYGTEHFFQHVANKVGAEALIELMNQMPSSSEVDQLQRFHHLPRIAPLFHTFAQELLSEELIDSSGRFAEVPPPMSEDILEFNQDTLTIAFEQARPYTIRVKNVILPPGYYYDFRAVSEDGSAHYKVSINNTDENVFHSLPSSIETSCDLTETYNVLLTPMAPTQNAQFIKIIGTRRPKEQCLCSTENPQPDQCLLGNWNLDVTTLKDMILRQIGNQPVKDLDISGNEIMSFLNNNEGDDNFHFIAQGTSTDPKTQGMKVKFEWMGQARYKWSTASGGKFCGTQISRNYKALMTITYMGQTYTLPMDGSSGAGGMDVMSTYKCQENELLISGEMIDPKDNKKYFYQMRYTR